MGGKSVIFDKFQLEKCDDANQNTTGVDWLSRLPDDILVGILSTLPLKEAARTSILSPRWENLWKHTSHLNFDDDSALCRYIRHLKNAKKRSAERRKYINWVNQVIRSYKGFALKEFRICFDLDKTTAQKAINRWVRFAFERRVERLELDLSIRGEQARGIDVCTFPMKFFKPHQPRSLFDSLKYLKALCLRSVDVTDKDVDVFLRSCPLLENLVIDYARKILNLNICGPLALKHLEMRRCYEIKSLRISAPNLISLLVANPVPVLLDFVPKLVVVNVRSYDEQLPYLVPALFCCLSQLEILTVDLSLKKELMEKYSKCKFPELPKLKKLEIFFAGKGDESMIGLTTLIRAAPYIQELLIKISWYKLLRTHRNIRNDNIKNEIHSPHQHLKVVKFLGYFGRSSDLELVKYLVDYCDVLETLVIDPRYQTYYVHAPLDPDEIDGLVEEGELTFTKKAVTVFPDEFDGLDAVRTSRKYAKQQLQGQIPQHIQLLIL